MDTAKRNNLIEWLLFGYLVLFPFGQLLRVVHAVDVVAFLFMLAFLFFKFEPPQIYKQIKTFFFVSVFSLIFSLVFFNIGSVVLGSLYLLRLFAYFSMFFVLWNYVRGQRDVKEKFFTSLLFVLVVLAIFGWIQYFFYPDVRGLYWLGWDDHLYRLLGTILDPGFMGMLLVFGFLMSLGRYIEKKKNNFLFLCLFFLISVAFTYARSSYLALFGGALVFLIQKRKFMELLAIVVVFGMIVTFLPRPEGEGVNLQRLNSIRDRLTNYRQSLILIQKSPVFGLGFNNICEAKVKFFGEVKTKLHSCSGLDSSFLFILATGGAIGFIVFVNLAASLIKGINNDFYGSILTASLAALFIDSVFINSLFYPWVMGYLVIIFALSYKEK